MNISKKITLNAVSNNEIIYGTVSYNVQKYSGIYKFYDLVKSSNKILNI